MKIQAAGQDVESAGRRITRVWAGMGAVYHAPEAGQLYAAMTPVQSQASEFSRQADQVASALRDFAQEAYALQQQAKALAPVVQHFNTWAAHHDHWWDNIAPTSPFGGDLSKKDMDAKLTAAANNLGLAWQAAERRCANRINALDHGPTYLPTPKNGDNPFFIPLLAATNQQYYGNNPT